MSIFSKKEAAIEGYDFSTAEAREKTAADLFTAAKNWRCEAENDWKTYNDYYNFIHDATSEMKDYCDEHGIPFVPPVLPDCYMQVESQVSPNVPEPEFRGRSGDEDSEKAKRREFAVRYVLENNRVSDSNTANERRLVKLGDAYWKAYWDRDMRCGLNEGDIRVKDIPVENVYPDPSCEGGDIQTGQFVVHVYALHKVKFAQTFAAELKKLGTNVNELMNSGEKYLPTLFELYSNKETYRDCIPVMECWYRQPEDYYDAKSRTTVPAGAVACSVLAGGKEIKNIPQYWVNTGKQCQLFPFVHYWRIRDENSFFNKSELFAIKDMIDAGDRKLGNALINDAMMCNDIIVAEENSFAEGGSPVSEPGAVWVMKSGRANAVKRLGGFQSGAAGIQLTNFISEQIQRTNRNYDTNMGKETSRQTTASGLAMLRDDADSQAEIKKKDRLLGFERLFELIDWLCLEFYDADRMLFIGAKDDHDKPTQIKYNSSQFASQFPPVTDDETGETVREAWTYYPRVDVTVNAGDGVVRGKQATAQVLEKLASSNVSQVNYKLLEAELDVLDIPQKGEITEFWESLFAPAVPKEVTDALAGNPQLLQMVTELISASALAQGGGNENAVSQMQAGNAADLPGGV